MKDLHVNHSLTLPAAALSWSASRSEGPGGQHVNKSATKVELILDPEEAELPRGVIARLRRKAPRLFDSDGLIHVTSQDTRSQRRNLKDARAKLARLLRESWQPPKRRRRTRPTRASVRRRLERKRRRGKKKRDRAWRPKPGD